MSLTRNGLKSIFLKKMNNIVNYVTLCWVWSHLSYLFYRQRAQTHSRQNLQRLDNSIVVRHFGHVGILSDVRRLCHGQATWDLFDLRAGQCRCSLLSLDFISKRPIQTFFSFPDLLFYNSRDERVRCEQKKKSVLRHHRSLLRDQLAFKQRTETWHVQHLDDSSSRSWRQNLYPGSSLQPSCCPHARSQLLRADSIKILPEFANRTMIINWWM